MEELDKYFSGELDPKIQYASREQGIKAFAEEYSFNIESELFNQLTKEQQALWRKEIEQAVLSGGYCGLNLVNDKRYDKEKPVSEDLEKIVGEIAEPTILNAYGTKELARRLHNTICGTSVSKDLKKAADEYADRENPTCTCEECLIKTFKDGANWQKVQDQSTIELAEDHAMLAGMEKMEQQMIANAVETTFNVSLPSGLYDKLLIKGCKEGDKLLVIKKDEL